LSQPVSLQVHPFPHITLAADTVVCHTPLLLNAGTQAADYSYQWSDNSIAPSIEIKQSGDYSVQVSNGHCTATNQIRVQILDPKQVEIPNVITPNNDQADD
jgi:hypothetical protein